MIINDNTKYMLVNMGTFLIENGIELIKQQVDNVNIMNVYVSVERRNRSDEDIDKLMRTFKVQYTLALMSALHDNGGSGNNFELKLKYKVKEK